ncbi:Polyphenol oxidase chloroplastic [Bienertia sinuspersici]
MASLSPITTTTTTTKNLSSASLNPLSSKPSQLSAFGSNRSGYLAPRISYNVAKNDETNKFDRRNMLIGLGGLYGATTTLSGGPAAIARPTAQTTATPSLTFPKSLGNRTLRTNLPRAVKSRSKNEKEDEEEVLIIEVDLKRDVYSKFDVFVNDEDDAPTKENRVKAEYAGSFVNVPHKHKHSAKGNLMTTTIKFALTDLIEDLGADDDDGIDITFVPRTGTESMVIKDVRIEFLD